MSSRPAVCKKDNSSYKALTQRWTKQRSLRTWWENSSPEDKVVWYNKQQSLATGTKRRFEEVGYSEQTKHSVEDLERDFDMMRPWWWFLSRGLKEGKTLPEIEEEWRDITENNKDQCIFRRGQWLVPIWESVMKAKDEKTVASHQTTRAAEVMTSEQLTQLQAGGAQILSQFANTILPVPQTYVEAPVTNATLPDQPFLAQAQDVMAQQMHREASLLTCRGT